MSDNRRLDSWKEIAGYVGRTEKTIQRYEKTKHFPIHRIAGGSKERVFAYTDEIDRWFDAQQDLPGDQNHEASEPLANGLAAPRWPWRRLLPWSIMGLALVLTMSFLWVSLDRPGTPSQLVGVQVQGNTLTAVDKNGQPLWQRSFEAPLEKAPSLAIATIAVWSFNYEKLIYSGDLNRDGSMEIFVLVGSYAPAFNSYKLMCLDESGATKWSYAPGERLRYGADNYDDLWRIEFFLVEDLDGDGRDEVIVNSHQRLHFPAKISVLRADGQLVGHYYHSGWIESIAIHDLDGDGKKELLCGGTNNGFKKGILFVLDIREIRGSSPPSGVQNYDCASMPPGREKFYLLFPRDCLNRALLDTGSVDQVMTSATSVETYHYSYAQVANPGAAIFMLNYQLVLKSVVANSAYLALHRHLENTGFLNHSFTQAELDGLEPILYWDGEEFKRAPAMNRFWITRSAVH